MEPPGTLTGCWVAVLSAKLLVNTILVNLEMEALI